MESDPSLNSSSFTHSTGKFVSDRTELFYQSWISNDPKPLCTFVIVHGLGDHSGHYMTIVTHFSNCNFYGYDKRGHGNSPGKKGHIDTWEEFRTDLKVFLAFVQEKQPNSPLVLFGNSMGGLLTIDYLEHNPDKDIRGAIVNAPALNFSDIGPVTSFAFRCMRAIAGRYQINVGLDSKKLTNDPELQKENDEDKLVHSYATPSLFVELNNVAIYSRNHPELLSTPTLMIQGDQDPIITPSTNKKFMEQVVQKYPASKLYMAEKCKHEAFNDIPERREAIFKVMQKWLDQLLAPL